MFLEMTRGLRATYDLKMRILKQIQGDESQTSSDEMSPINKLIAKMPVRNQGR